MKKLFLFTGILMFFTSLLFSQDKSSPETLIDRYFKSYAAEPEYKTSTMTEEMMKPIKDRGVWGNPVFDKFMREINLYKMMRFKSTKEHSQQIFAGVEAEMKKDQLYKSYLKLENDRIKSYYFVKYNGDKITEFVFITLNNVNGFFLVSSFNGDNINIDTLRAFMPDNPDKWEH